MNIVEQAEISRRSVDERQRLGRIQIAKDAMFEMFGEHIVLEDAFAERQAELFGGAFEFLANRFVSDKKGA